MSIMDDVVGNDKNYQALQEKLKTAKKEDQAAILKQMTDFVEGTAIGQIISDRQALMALLGIRNNVELGKEVNQKVEHSEKAVDISHQVVKSTNDYKVEDLKNAAEFAQMESLKGFNNLLGSTAETLTEYAKQYPELTTALAGAATGIGALGAAALAAAGSISLLGGGKSGGWLPEMGKNSKGGSLSPSASGGKGGIFRKGLGFAGKAFSAYGVVSAAQTLGEQAAPTLARSEAKTEQQAVAKQQFGQAVAAQHKPTGGFAYGGSPLGVKSNGTPLYGGYVLAHAQFDNEIAKARLAQGSYTQTQYEARVQRNHALTQSVTAPQAVNSGQSSATQAVSGFAQRLADIASVQGTMQGQFDTLSTQFPQYHAEMQTLASTLPQALQAGLAAQNHTIDNRIVVELDGRVIAEQTSQHMFNFANRGPV